MQEPWEEPAQWRDTVNPLKQNTAAKQNSLFQEFERGQLLRK